ncbi:hypothetical protein MRB53_018287 [Persea americana]|uniref:Uncharacterized protein n=1 Tax=Persea americana TaxID=3435 RepID=A0ACC2M813_PERAE|nr:hypothetical protein MRB53_018287 [Persea americana]
MALFDCHHSWGHTLAALLTCHCSLKAPLKLDRTAHIPSSPTVLRSTSHQGCLPIHPSLLPHYIIPPPFSASSFPSFEPERDGFHSLSLSLACSRNSKKTATKVCKTWLMLRIYSLLSVTMELGWSRQDLLVMMLRGQYFLALLDDLATLV